jgi:hypothetical protein
LQPEERSLPVAIMLIHFEVDDYDAWKPLFDEDPAGRAEAGATSYKVSRAVDNPNEAFIRVEFPSVDQAKAFREKLLASGALERGGMRLKSGPTVAVVDDEHTY